MQLLRGRTKVLLGSAIGLSAALVTVAALPSTAGATTSRAATDRASIARAAAGATGTDDVVRVSGGALRGQVSADGRQFLGVPFAAPPVGPLRFRPPQPVAPWFGIRSATASAPACEQPSSGFGGVPPMSEDCLDLDVYTPPVAPASTFPPRKAPVMVWIHGGGLTTGWVSGYDPRPLVKSGVIVVEIAYRLGAFGFLGLPELQAEPSSFGSVGNAGLLDQQAGLRWVKRNIAGFGGDPHNVTIFGQSAGGGSVCDQLVSPLSAGLFERAIPQSGACEGQTFPTFDRAHTFASGAALATGLGCTDVATRLACLRSKPASAILADPSATPGLITGLSFSPTVDGVVLRQTVQDSLRDGHYYRVPVMLGNTHDEARFMIATMYHLQFKDVDAAEYRRVVQQRYGAKNVDAILAEYPLSDYPSPALALSAVLTDSMLACATPWSLEAMTRPGQRLYGYELDDVNPPLSGSDPFMPLGNFHTADLFYLFAKVQGVATPTLDANQQRLSDQMIAAWTTFARTGRPGSAVGIQWPAWHPGSPQVMQLTSLGNHTITNLAAEHRCDFWKPING